jgi:hypothetical protein
MFKRVDGFEYLAITEPAAKKSFHRVAWAQYGEGVNVEDVVKQLNGAKVCPHLYWGKVPTNFSAD